jgi:UDPglucose 6-dehydrogenase
MRYDLGENMKIAVIGLGFVGLSLSSVLASKGYNVIGIDTDIGKCKKIRAGIPPFFEPNLEKTLRIALKKKLIVSNDFLLIKNCDMIFVTVGTPQKSNGEIELSMIRKSVTDIGIILAKTSKNPIILIKSTVIPTTMQNVILPILEKISGKKAGKEFGLISNPEFLQESNAIKDTKFPHLIVLGGYQTKFMKKAKSFFSKLHPNISIIVTNHQTAEMIKYANNSFLATKISFINQISNICQNIPGANVDDIAKTIGLDPRIGTSFLNAGPGYGGFCLPKDMKALINFADKVGIHSTLLNAVENTNQKQMKNIISVIEKTLGTLASKRITILGTAFKPNTDDVRGSIAIELIKKLLKKKVKITIYDPKAMKNTSNIFGKKIVCAKSVTDALNKSQCVILITEWKQFERLNNNSIKHMSKKFIIDCRRILVEKELDAEYHAIGVGKI